jgi:hypothetical protein
LEHFGRADEIAHIRDERLAEITVHSEVESVAAVPVSREAEAIVDQEIFVGAVSIAVVNLVTGVERRSVIVHQDEKSVISERLVIPVEFLVAFFAVTLAAFFVL